MTVVRGYHEASYGDGMADVYDEWYGTDPSTDAAVEILARLAGDGPILELGVGTGRMALPLAARGIEVYGIDASAAMLERLRSKPGGDAVHATAGDMAGTEPPGPFRLVFAVANTFFNLLTDEAQRAAITHAAARLTSDGRLVLEAFVPTVTEPTSSVQVRSMSAGHVVLSVSRSDGAGQRAEGQYVELSETGGVRLRPWAIRWATPDQLDAMAAAASLELEHRWAGWRGEPFDAESAEHVSVWRRSPGVG